jgi:hypothetical protein
MIEIDAPISPPPDAAPVTFVASGSAQSYLVPAGYTRLRVAAHGASGGDSATFSGHGAIVDTIVPAPG